MKNSSLLFFDVNHVAYFPTELQQNNKRFAGIKKVKKFIHESRSSRPIQELLADREALFTK